MFNSLGTNQLMPGRRSSSKRGSTGCGLSTTEAGIKMDEQDLHTSPLTRRWKYREGPVYAMTEARALLARRRRRKLEGDHLTKGSRRLLHNAGQVSTCLTILLSGHQRTSTSLSNYNPSRSRWVLSHSLPESHSQTRLTSAMDGFTNSSTSYLVHTTYPLLPRARCSTAASMQICLRPTSPCV